MYLSLSINVYTLCICVNFRATPLAALKAVLVEWAMFEVSLPLGPRDSLENEYLGRAAAYEELLQRTARNIGRMLEDAGIRGTVKYRVKSFTSWYTKLLSRIQRAAGQVRITDVLGIRIVCPFLHDLAAVSSLLQTAYTVEEVDHKGSDDPYQSFGYQSIHLLLRFAPSESIGGITPVCEVQIRTILQDAWAEVEHELIYKSEFTPLDEPLRRKLAAINANLTLSDIMFQEIRDYQSELHQALKKRRQGFYDHIRRAVGIHSGEKPSEKRAAGAGGTSAPETMDSLLLQGLTAHNENRLDDAIAVYSKITALNPKPFIASVILVHRGMAYFSKGDYGNASRDFSAALEIDGNNTKARYYQALVDRIEGRLEKALTGLHECLALEPYNIEYLFSRAEVLSESGNIPAALEDCMTIMQIDPSFTPVRELRARLEEEG
jgi:putative GTP pyrophosphokinase